MQGSLLRRSLAEFVGTFWLVFAGIGAANLSFEFGGDDGDDFGVGPIGVALAFGVALLTAAYTIGHISGCHINPAVTVGAWVAGKFPGHEVAHYVIAQCLGGVVGCGVLLLVLTGSSHFDLSGGFASNGFGEHSPDGYSVWQALVMEVVVTAMLVLVVMGTTSHSKAQASAAPAAIGLTLFIAVLVAMPVDNGSVNPARSIAPAVYAGRWALGQLWAFVAGPLAGGCIGGLVFRYLLDEGADGEGAQGSVQGTPLRFSLHQGLSGCSTHRDTLHCASPLVHQAAGHSENSPLVPMHKVADMPTLPA